MSRVLTLFVVTSINPSNNQTTKQPNNQTTKQPNNQTTKQPNNQTTKQLDKYLTTWSWSSFLIDKLYVSFGFYENWKLGNRMTKSGKEVRSSKACRHTIHLFLGLFSDNVSIA